MKILLKEIMESKHLSIRQVAYSCEISKSKVQRIMSGSADPTMGTIEKLAKGLNVKMEDLYESEFK